MTTDLKTGVLRSLAILMTLVLVGGRMPLRADDPTDDSQPPVALGDDNTSTAVPDQSTAAAQTAPLPPEQIDTLVAPIALYPDPIISQVLVASTYPLELVQADQWLKQHPELQGQALKDAAAQMNWDPSVQALVLFPDVIHRLNSDISWTTQLGNAFLAQQGDVMGGIQRMRVKAQQAGRLTTTDQQKVITTTDSGQPVIEIQPVDSDVIYVPVYNPVWIWGPPVTYYYPAWYYPPPPDGGWFLWGPAFRMSIFYPGWIGFGGWGGWGWRPGWHDHDVIVNHTFFVNNHYRPVHYENLHDRTVWVHSPEHRMGVAYPNHEVAQHFNSPHPEERTSVARPTVHQVQEQFHQRAVIGTAERVTSTRPTVNEVQQQFHQRATSGAMTQRIGNRTIPADTFTRNRSAFGGPAQGTVTRAFSQRGRSSLGQVSRAPARTSAPSRGEGQRQGNRNGGSDGGGRR